MATTEDSSEVPEEPVDETGKVEEVIESAAEKILKGEYRKAYNRIAAEEYDDPVYVRSDNYRNGKAALSRFSPEVAQYLSEVVTEEPFKGVRTLDQAEKGVKCFARYVFSDHSDI